jgi:predicted dehydrogenase
MTDLKFAIFGTGFWSRYQIAGWQELEGVQCVAAFNRTRAKAEQIAAEFGIARVYDDPEQLLASEELDFVDICTNVETHSQYVHMAASRRLPVICQKPLAVTLDEAKTMVTTCQQAGVPLLVNENFRWQHPIRQFRHIMAQGRIGRPFRARVQFISSFPVFDNQPFLKELEQFILTDVGTHILDVARFLFGEAHTLYCQIDRINPGIKGEDVATVMMNMGDSTTVICELSYASRTETERFPETYIFVEGDRGSLELGPDFWIRETTEAGTLAKRYPPPRYPWADPAYDVVHASIVPCQANLLAALRGETPAETTGEDNLKTLRLVFGAYQSASSHEALHF